MPWPVWMETRQPRWDLALRPSLNPSPTVFWGSGWTCGCHTDFPSLRLSVACLHRPRDVPGRAQLLQLQLPPPKVSSPRLPSHALSLTMGLFERSPPGPSDPADHWSSGIWTWLLLFLPAPTFPILWPVPPRQQWPHSAALCVRIRGQGARWAGPIPCHHLCPSWGSRAFPPLSLCKLLLPSWKSSQLEAPAKFLRIDQSIAQD